MAKSKLTQLTPDKKNANKGTERGRYMVEKSLQELGAGRSILVDKNGNIIAGNKTAEAAASIGLEDTVIVETDGTKLVVVKRTDLDLDDPTGKARQLAYADNRTSEVSYELDPFVMASDIEAGLDLSAFYFDYELENIFEQAGSEPIDPNEHWQGMPEFENEDKTSYQSIHIHFKTPEEVQEFSKLIGQSLTEKTRSIWFSQREQMLNAKERYTS